MHLHFGVQGCEVANLLPLHGGVMWRLVQDVITADPIREVRVNLLAQLEDVGEFETLGIDCSVKVAMGVLGQTPNAGAAGSSAFAENDQLRKVLSVVGRTGSVLSLCAIPEESAENICVELTRAFTREQLAGVRHVGSDNPSAHMFDSLKAVLPNLSCLFLDATHLAMAVEKCRDGKHSATSRALRRVMAKFAAFGAGGGPALPFTGRGAVPLTKAELDLRDAILGKAKAMSAAQADVFLDQLPCSKPFASRLEFCTALAAIAALYPAEMRRKGHKGRRVGRLLAGALVPSKCAWYFNNHVHRRSLDAQSAALLPSGTTSNEALHNELREAFRQTVRLHQATLATKLMVFSLAKLVVHVLASLRPTTRQMPPGQIRARALAREAFSQEAWQGLCERREAGRPLRKSVSALARWRRVNVAKVRKWLRKMPATHQERQRKKRTVFTMKRRSTSGPSALRPAP